MKGQIINDVIVAFGNQLYGENIFDIPDDYSPERYTYTPSVAGVFDPNGFTSIAVIAQVDSVKRQMNLNSMNSYMASFIGNGMTQANFDLFLSDTAALQQQYVAGGGRLITWIETTNRNGYNAATTGFKTRSAYNGVGVSQTSTAFNPRANRILEILNDL